MLLIQVKGIHTLGFRFFFFFYTVADKRYQEEIKKKERVIFFNLFIHIHFFSNVSNKISSIKVKQKILEIHPTYQSYTLYTSFIIKP